MATEPWRRALLRALRLTLWGFAPFLACSPSWAHNQDFIAAAIQQGQGGLELWLAVDTLGQTQLQDEAAARAALANAVEIVAPGQPQRSLAQTGSLDFDQAPDWTQCLPMSLQPGTEDAAHGFVTARWRCASTQPFQLRVPRGNRLDVLLWRLDDDGAVQSQLLLPAETSPLLRPGGPTLPRTRAAALLALLIVALLLLRRRGIKTSQSINSP